ncbi:helix-turn-helix domain-containing protein [Larkinella insperata]|uniref:Helix-turn-helix domain-containing protein n=1 Tax=Larkinella insperata TaxID=332158 RepID=A0ABW3Q7E4_9BACT|nr:helix-turn-helix domain-containing protein [Larkinella insperata]
MLTSFTKELSAMESPPITFDQLPAYVYQLGCKFDQLLNLLQAQAGQPNDAPEQFFTIEQLSDYLPGKPAITTLYGKVQRREIPFIRKGKRLTFRRADIDQWLIDGRTKTSTELADQYVQSKERRGGRRAA